MSGSAKTPTKTHRCTVCDATEVYETRPYTMTYKDNDFTLDSEGWWCTECGEGDIEGEEIVRVAALFKDFKAKVNETLQPSEMQATSEKLNPISRRQNDE